MITDLEKKEIFEKTLFFYTSIQFNELNLKGALGNNFETVEDFKKMLFSENTRTFFRNAITIKNSEEFIKHIDNEFELFNIYNVTSNELKIKWLQITYNYIVNKNDLSGFINKPTVVAFVKWYKITLNDLQPQQTDAVKPDEVLKKEFKDFFNSDVKAKVIESIQNDFKDFKGKKMAYLIYLLHRDFKVINYSLNSKTESRKHFVSILKGCDFRMTGIDKYFKNADVTLDGSETNDPDYSDIKEKLLKTIIQIVV